MAQLTLVQAGSRRAIGQFETIATADIVARGRLEAIGRIVRLYAHTDGATGEWIATYADGSQSAVIADVVRS